MCISNEVLIIDDKKNDPSAKPQTPASLDFFAVHWDQTGFTEHLGGISGAPKGTKRHPKNIQGHPEAPKGDQKHPDTPRGTHWHAGEP